MTISQDDLTFTDTDLKELFELFSSSTKYELARIYEQGSESHFERIELNEEYELIQERREFALDAARAVLYFLCRRGYRLEMNGEIYSLDGITRHFV
jgi:hypothetical protein